MELIEGTQIPIHPWIHFSSYSKGITGNAHRHALMKWAMAFLALLSWSIISNHVVALGGGPQPGSVVHPPNLREWLLGEAQAIRQIYS